MITRLAITSIAFASLIVVGGCGGGGGGGGAGNDGDDTPMVQERVVYVADQEVDERNELFLVSTNEPGVSTRLNPPLVDGGNVSLEPRFTPDGQAVIYRADAEVDDVTELWLTDLAAPGAATRLNEPLVPDGDVVAFQVIDGSSPAVLYLADQEVDEQFELFLVQLDNPGVATRINPALDPGRSVHSFGPSFRVSPDGTRVAYQADQDTDDVDELYLVDLDTPESSEKVNGTLVPGGEVSSFEFSPDGQWITYRADELADQVFELFLVDLDDPGNSERLNPDLVGGGFVNRSLFTPDSASVVYRAEQDTDDQLELYLVDIDQPGTSTKLNPPLDPDRDVAGELAILPDSSGVVYRADQDEDDLMELYLVPFDSPGSAVKLSAQPQQDDGVRDFKLSADGERVVYVSEQETFDLEELFVVELDSPGTSTRVSQDLPGSRFGVSNLLPFRPDARRIPYITDETADGNFELFIVSVDDPGNATRLNSPLSGVNELVGEAEAVEFSP